jgi:type I restriction enzyme S subunit
VTTRQYPAYKASGTTWLGDVPDTWAVERLKRGFVLKKRPVLTTDGNVTAFRDGQVTLRSKRRTDGFTEADKEIGYQGVEPDDLVIHAMDAFAGAIGVSDSRGKSTPVYSVCRAHPGYEPRYFALTLRHIALSGYIASLGKGVRERSTDFRWNDAKDVLVPVPSVEEQLAILSYLDTHIAEIDLLIEKQEQLIETLAERRRAVISYVVTKGLNPRVPMKDSGRDWMGRVPQGWAVEKLSSHFIAKKGSNAGLLTREYCASVPGNFPVYSGQTENGGVMAEIDTHEFDGGADGVLFSTTVGARAMTVQHIFGKFSLSQNCMIIQKRGNLTVRYYYYLFQALFEAQRRELSAHMQPSFRMSDLYAYRILVPTETEQRAMADFLDGETNKIGSLSGKAREMISILKERRQALISAAVTGKIDVRGLS